MNKPKSTEQNLIDAMNDSIFKKLREGYVMDLKKPELDPFERASIISGVIEENNWSQREFARQFNIPKSTVEDWLLFNRIEPQEYDDLVKSGVTPTQIYRDLRDRKKEKPGKKIQVSELDIFLKTAIKDFTALKEFIITDQSEALLAQLRAVLVNVELKMKEKQKNDAKTKSKQ